MVRRLAVEQAKFPNEPLPKHTQQEYTYIRVD
jgi:hypothetical protein